jgi:hypothetical protein
MSTGIEVQMGETKEEDYIPNRVISGWFRMHGISGGSAGIGPKSTVIDLVTSSGRNCIAEGQTK